MSLDGVRDHYRASGLTERLNTALTAFGPDEQRLTPQQLATLDQFHTRGLAATVELAKLAGIAADMSVLDVGSGVGGPARFLAATYGCQVTGIDLSEPFVDAARYLTKRTGQSERVSFENRQCAGTSRSNDGHFRRRVSAACGNEHLRPGATLSRDPARAEVKRKVCDLRRRVEPRRPALSRPLATNAGHELSSDRRPRRAR